jgi:uncharacterized protein involved in exopolysaccharide biosynthesis
VRRLERQFLEVSGRNAGELQRFRQARVDAQAAQLDGEIRENEAALRGLRAEVATIQKRLDAAPGRAEQYRVLSRDYETLRAKYTTAVARAADARAAEALLAADAPGLFRVVQAAVAPTKHAAPNRLSLALVALAAAVGAALLAVVVAEYFDSSLRGAQDAGGFGVPVLAVIPRIGPRRTAGQR